MPYALALMVICPLTEKLKPVEECKRCGNYFGIMSEEMLNCSIIEEEKNPLHLSK